ncbi:protein kinase domain-containing protein [Gorillibacterium massiliense]|uniref:protein kinase domain-containing protein n=1 Tax=Gorillibacterium massiliense TaxID=1280390 RepID=UPI0004B57F12|nr:hypothetical protein [Gorillibacterium massiliense]
MSFDGDWTPGGNLTGKWNGRSYRIVRKLGAGANGSVYLVQRNKGLYALKIGFDTADLQSEVNALSQLSKGEGPFFRFMLEADDCMRGGRTLPFYVMEYIEGKQISEFILMKGKDWVSVVGHRLLGLLTELHKRGWIFGDLKTDNVLVSGYGEVRLVDFGGLTRKGKAVKQFTELYDRGYWDAGLRTAEEGYDLFACGILLLQLLGIRGDIFSSKVLPQNRNVSMLLAAMEETPECRNYASCIGKLLSGSYASSREAREDWRRTVFPAAPASVAHASRGSKNKGSSGGWLKMGITVSVLLFLSAILLVARDYF